MQTSACDGAVGNRIRERVLRVDAGSGDIQVRERRDRKPPVESRKRIARAVGNGRVETVAESSVAKLSKPRPMSEHLVRHDQKKMILGHVEREELPRSIEDAERKRRTTALCADLEWEPSIFYCREEMLRRQEPLRARGRRHV